jgi:enoyl-CoA hydratase/carnithine racemase
MSDLLVDRDGPVTIFTLNRPRQMNALSRRLRADLESAVHDFESDPQQLVGVFTGAGDRAFSAGADLKEMASETNQAAGPPPVVSVPDLGGVGACEKVTIAAVNGLAVAGGMELSLCCDIRYAADTAWFGLSEVSRGMIAGVAANILPRLLPYGAVAELMLSGDRMSAEEARRLGLVQRVFPAAELMERVLDKARTIARQSPAAVWGTKQVIKFWRDALLAEQHVFYQAVAHRVLLSGDYLEGPRAFAEGRQAQFSQRWPDKRRAGSAGGE